MVDCIKDINDVLPDVGDKATFITPTSSATCGITLPPGETFIFFVNTATGEPFSINLCSTKVGCASLSLSLSVGVGVRGEEEEKKSRLHFLPTVSAQQRLSFHNQEKVRRLQGLRQAPCHRPCFSDSRNRHCNSRSFSVGRCSPD